MESRGFRTTYLSAPNNDFPTVQLNYALNHNLLKQAKRFLWSTAENIYKTVVTH
jgi:hypothetical protein